MYLLFIFEEHLNLQLFICIFVLYVNTSIDAKHRYDAVRQYQNDREFWWMRTTSTLVSEKYRVQLV